MEGGGVPQSSLGWGGGGYPLPRSRLGGAGGTRFPGSGGVPPVRKDGGTTPLPGPGKGVPLPGLGMGVLPWTWEGVPFIQNWEGGSSPQPGPGKGVPSTPHCQPDGGTPRNGAQSENITFRHPSDAGGNKNAYILKGEYYLVVCSVSRRKAHPGVLM